MAHKLLYRSMIFLLNVFLSFVSIFSRFYYVVIDDKLCRSERINKYRWFVYFLRWYFFKTRHFNWKSRFHSIQCTLFDWQRMQNINYVARLTGFWTNMWRCIWKAICVLMNNLRLLRYNYVTRQQTVQISIVLEIFLLQKSSLRHV